MTIFTEIEKKDKWKLRAEPVVLNDGFLQRCIYFVFGDFKKFPYLIKIWKEDYMKIQLSDHFTYSKLIRYALPSVIMTMFIYR